MYIRQPHGWHYITQTLFTYWIWISFNKSLPSLIEGRRKSRLTPSSHRRSSPRVSDWQLPWPWGGSITAHRWITSMQVRERAILSHMHACLSVVVLPRCSDWYVLFFAFNDFSQNPHAETPSLSLTLRAWLKKNTSVSSKKKNIGRFRFRSLRTFLKTVYIPVMIIL